MLDARGLIRRLTRVVRERIPSVDAPAHERIEPAAPSVPAEATAPMPSLWFRSAALLDVRALQVRATAQPNASRLVNGISLTISRGEVVGLVGNASSGAREVAQCIAGVLPITFAICSGSILFNGVELVGVSAPSRGHPRDTKLAYLSLDPLDTLDPASTVGAQLTAPLRSLLGLSKPAAYERAIELLHEVGIDHPEHTFTSHPRDLSPIRAQRVQIARALVGDPNLIVADDPTAALKASDGADILQLLRRLQGEQNWTMIIVTPSVSVAAQICHRVAVMCNGEIVEYASVTDLFGAPAHPYTRELLFAYENEWPSTPAL
jgi:ABC-type glutathione transport system ATPase component